MSLQADRVIFEFSIIITFYYIRVRGRESFRILSLFLKPLQIRVSNGKEKTISPLNRSLEKQQQQINNVGIEYYG
jgi:hypothetical protein